MKKEAIEFLKSLKEDLLTQDTDCQADPRFWVVAQYEWHGVPLGNHDDFHYYDSDAAETYESFDAWIETQKNYGVDGNWDEYTCYDDLPSDIQEYLTEVPVAKVHVVKQDTFFLTKKQCQDHIARNDYHYNDTVHTYAMTAWRSPQFEKLISLLKTTDWDSIQAED